MKRFALIFPALISLWIFSCKEEVKQTIKTKSVEFTKEGELSLFKSNTDSLLAKLDIEIAQTDYETQTGLMYRNQMNENQGMLFIFPDMSLHSFYMKNTKIPLDIIFLDDQQKIASFQENAKPMDETGLSSQVPVKYALEINAGLAEKWRLEIGDRMEFKRFD
jgi:uncharacterized membrane protein (UPF0127 family)